MNDDLIAKVSSATSAADIKRMAAENGVALTDADAEAVFAKVQKAVPTKGAISDDELNGATGGKSESVPDKFDPLLIEIINRKQGVLYEGQKSERKVRRV